MCTSQNLLSSQDGPFIVWTHYSFYLPMRGHPHMLNFSRPYWPSHRESTYWSPHLVYFTFSKYMVGPRSLAWKPLKVKKCVMPDLKVLMCVKLREEDQEWDNFLKMCCVLLKNGVFDENHWIASSTFSLNLQLINFSSFWAWKLIFLSHSL